MRMVRWMCGVKLSDRIPSKGLRERLGLDDIIYSKTGCDGNRHVLRKDNDW